MNNPAKHWRDAKKLHKNLNRVGRLIAWTRIFTPPKGFEYQAPYFVGIIELPDHSRIPVQIVDCGEEDLKINLKVKLVVRRLKKPGSGDIIDYALKAVPLN